VSETLSENTYQLYVSYDPDADDLASSLEFLSKVVSNQSRADKIMAHGMEAGLSTKIILDDIQKSSIRLFLINSVKNTDEAQIRDKGAKAFWHQFLVEVRKPFLDYASNHETLEQREDLVELRNQAVRIAQDNNINPVPIEGMPDEQIAKCLADYSVPSGLGPNQSFKAICGDQEFSVNKNFKVTSDQVVAVLEGKEQTLFNQTVYLKPKTAVYEGDGMWDFHVPNSSGTVKGKILHDEWLQRFQQGNLKPAEYPFPGTILKARADIIVKFDESNFRRGEMYHIKEIFGPVSRDDVAQENFDRILNTTPTKPGGERH